jgi:hypothetical protein
VPLLAAGRPPPLALALHLRRWIVVGRSRSRHALVKINPYRSTVAPQPH